MLSNVSQTQREKYLMIISLIYGILKSGTNELIYKQKYSHRCRKPTCGYQGGKVRKEG